MNVKPTEIRRNGVHELSITWTDGRHDAIASTVLRSHCPCAKCREERGEGASHSSPLTASPTKKKSLLRVVENTREESLTLESIWGVGNYGLGISWGDGHNDGIYTFDYLRTLAQK
ncbi:MAG: DUF971 domain-containing protein [Bdellovibrionales bacterium]|nr:DUF971 domain-containing protein [Bdellovibrionales bacterium]